MRTTVISGSVMINYPFARSVCTAAFCASVASIVAECFVAFARVSKVQPGKKASELAPLQQIMYKLQLKHRFHSGAGGLSSIVLTYVRTLYCSLFADKERKKHQRKSEKD